MISKIITNANGVSICSYCRMRVDPKKSNCPFCGNLLSNYETVMATKVVDKEKAARDEDTAMREALNIIMNTF